MGLGELIHRSFKNRHARRRAQALARSRAKRFSRRGAQVLVADSAIQLESLEPRVLLSGNALGDTLDDASSDTAVVTSAAVEATEAASSPFTITVHEGVFTIHDETTGLQNNPPNLDVTIDDNGNDVALDLDGTDPNVPDFPLALSSRLTALGADPSGAIGSALSGYDGSPTSEGENALTIDGGGFTIANLALSDANGDPLNGLDSGVTTTDDGNNVFLYTDTEDDNIVLGREGIGSTADPNGNIVLAIYLQEIPQDVDLIDVKLWTVQYEAVFHTTSGDGTTPQGSHDEVEPVDLTGNIFATAFRDLEFDLTNAPPGQNLFIMFGDGDIPDPQDLTEIGVVATGRDPLDESANPGTAISAGDTVNTSQAGSNPTVFGVNNQMITAAAGGEGEGIYFTFVTGPNADFTVPNLDQNEADEEINIDFLDVLDATAAEFEVVQLQGGKTAVVKVSAFSTTPNPGVDFIDGNGLTGNTPADIASVQVIDFDGGGEANITDNGDGTFTISGVEAGDIIKYDTVDDHNRVLIENVGDGSGQDSANFDIGGLKLIQADSATADVGVTLYFEDDGPAIDVQIIAAADPLSVDETDLGIDASADFSDNFGVTSDGGADGTAGIVTSYVLSVGTGGPTTNLVDVATGESVELSVNGSGAIEGRTETSGDLVFVVSVDAGGTVTLDQQRALEHPDTSDPDDTVTLAADLILLTRTDTITDGDGDQASDSESLDIGEVMSFDDDGPAIDVQIIAAADPLSVDETDLGIDASADFSDNFGVTSDGGADGTAGIVTSYVLSVGTGGPTTNLVDVATGESVELSVNGSGAIEGRTETGGDLVFVVSVDAGGTVTLDQQRALEHPDTSDPDDTVTLAADLILLTRTDTITDGDGDQASDSESLDIGEVMSFDDDGPAIDVQIIAAADPLSVDETDLGIDASADFSDNFGVTSDGGADGAAGIVTSYVLSVGTGGPTTNLVDVATGESVELSVNGSGAIEGRTETSGDLVFVVSVDAGGTVTLDQQRALEHPDTSDPDDTVTLAADLILLTRTDTITDGDGDQASDSESLDIGEVMSFDDDGPAIDVQIIAAADPLSVDETDLGIDASADFSDNFGVTSDGGADGAAGIVTSYVLSVGIGGPTTNLVDVATGESVELSVNGSGAIEGRTETSGDLVFVVSVDAGGTVTLDQQRALEHPNTSDPDDTVTLAADLILLTRTDTITDGDGDQASDSESLDIGEVMSFDDDGPAIDVQIIAAADPLSVDETDLGIDASADFSDNFGVTSDGGADGAAGIVTSYVLSVGTGGPTTNLVDVATGESVELSVNGSGAIEGRTETSGDLVFVVSVDAGGTVTLDQQRALEHPNTSDPDDTVTLAADLILLTRTDTITDGDGDQASDSESLDIGEVMSFDDDGPAIDVQIIAAADPLSVDETDLGIDASADFSDNFGVTSDGGADGAAGIVTSYVLSVGTGGPTTNLVDVATGESVELSVNGSGAIEGRTETSGDLVFVVSVDAGGTVTLDQQRALEHPNTSDPDDTVTLAADLILLTRTDTITDGDGDQASDSESLDIGEVMSFDDDGPAIDVQIIAAADPLSVDETDLGIDASADFSDNFGVTSDGGADGAAGIVTSYVLSVGTGGPTTNLVDVATGESVELSVNGSGAIEGRTETSGDLVFVVSVDAGGTVTLDQQRALEHPNTSDPDDTVTLAADLILLTRTDTITDGDGDQASDSESLDIGEVMSFDDDGPAIDVQIIAAADPLSVDETDLGIDASADFSDNFGVTSDGGADGAAGIVTSYVLSVGTGGPTTNLVDVATGESVELSVNGSGAIEGRTETSGDLVFVVSVDAGGTVTLDQQRALEHPNTSDPDDTVTLAADLILLTRTDTITDGDGDQASDSESLDIGEVMSFDDDGPALEFGNLVGTITTTPQVGFWEGLAGADQPGTLSIVAVDTDPTAAGIQFDMVTAAGVVTTGTIEFDDTTGTGTLTADFDNDPENGDETIGFSLTVNLDGTYVFTLNEVIVETITLSTDQGQLPAGGPDPVQTLSFGEGPDTTDFVFFAVDADTANNPSDIGTPIPLPVPPASQSPESAIGLGAFDLTEEELQDLSAMLDRDPSSNADNLPGTGDFDFIRDEIEMNVSNTGIGVNNNVLQGYDPNGGTDGSIDAFDPDDLPELDESFVINPEPLASEVKVFISKTAGGFLPPNPDGSLQGSPSKTDYLYWNLYDEEGNFTEAVLVTSDVVLDEADVAAGGTGENLWSFTLDLETLKDSGVISNDFGDFIDAAQFTMGFGDIKIPKIEVVVRGDNPPNDIFLDFSATLTDADGDTATSDFAIDLFGHDVDQAFDYVLRDAGAGDDAFNVDLSAFQTAYFVQGFDTASGDKLVLLSDLDAGIAIDNSGVDSVVTVAESGSEITTIVVAGVDLELEDIIELDTI